MLAFSCYSTGNRLTQLKFTVISPHNSQSSMIIPSWSRGKLPRSGLIGSFVSSSVCPTNPALNRHSRRRLVVCRTSAGTPETHSGEIQSFSCKRNIRREKQEWSSEACMITSAVRKSSGFGGSKQSKFDKQNKLVSAGII